MAKKTNKALKKLRKSITGLEEQNERLVERLEKQNEEHTVALRDVRALLEERLIARGAAPAEPAQEEAQEDHSTDGEADEGPEVTEAAERRAKELDVDLSDVKGTGSSGRVLVKDVEAAAEGN